MTSAELREAIRPYIKQFMEAQVNERSTQWSVYNADTQAKRNCTMVINAEFAPINRAKHASITREREIYQ